MDYLGSRLLLAGFAVKGKVDPLVAHNILRACIQAMDVKSVHTSCLYNYPADGKGGTGFTLIQPITESFLAVDSWPDHGGAYVVLASCKWFDPQAVKQVIIDMGLQVIGDAIEGLTLSHAKV